ncbi:MAG: hypothetical protein AABX47_08090 [Nanoarchaeota archaeon]
MRTAQIMIALALAIAALSICSNANQLVVDYMRAGDTAVIQANGKTYNLQLVIVSDAVQKAMFSLNGEMSRALRARERYTFSDGSQIIVTSILTKSHSSGSMVEYYFIASGDANIDRGVSGNTIVDLNYPYPDMIYDFSSLEAEGTQAPSRDLMAGKPLPAKPVTAVAPKEKDQCSSDADCDDHDGCTMDQCTGTPKKCVQTKTTLGCAFGTRYCVPYFRTYKFTPEAGAYCGLDGKWIDQAALGAACLGDYECSSGLCENKQCVEPTMKEEETPPLVSIPASIARTPASKNWWDQIFEFLTGLFNP